MQVYQVDCGDLICCSWGCWERFTFLFFVCTAPGVQLWTGPASACRSPEGICSLLRQDGVKGAADSGALAHLGRGEGGVRNAGQACGSRDQSDIATAWGAPCVLPGKLSLDHGTLAVAGCTGSQWCVDSDLHLHTGFFMAAAAELEFHARLWCLSCELWLAPVSGAHLSGLCLLWADGEEIPSPLTPQNNGILPLRQIQTFSQTPSRLAVAHQPPFRL